MFEIFKNSLFSKNDFSLNELTEHYQNELTDLYCDMINSEKIFIGKNTLKHVKEISDSEENKFCKKEIKKIKKRIKSSKNGIVTLDPCAMNYPNIVDILQDDAYVEETNDLDVCFFDIKQLFEKYKVEELLKKLSKCSDL